MTVALYVDRALHDGSLWFLLVCVALFAGVVIGFTDSGSGIARHPYSRPDQGGELASDLPPESIGRAELEPRLWRRSRAGRRRGG